MQLSHELGEMPNPSSVYTQTKYGLMGDMLNIIYGNISVAREVTMILKLLHIGVGQGGGYCNPLIHIHCLDFTSLRDILTMYRENLLKGDYLNLYPSTNGEVYTKLIRHMSKLTSRRLEDNFYQHTLWESHHVFTAIKKIEEHLET